jgi:hypothetical protein
MAEPCGRADQQPNALAALIWINRRLRRLAQALYVYRKGQLAVEVNMAETNKLWG